MERDNPHLDDFTAAALKEYGSYVVENRAIPDFRDGLKPSHRAVLWSMACLGLRNKGGYKKAARTVGDAIGQWHPHSDASVYDAMVTLANTKPALVEGMGNWGTPVDGAAAPRYTEAKLGKFADLFLLDPTYLKVVKTVPNFSNDQSWPLHFPATLPVLLLIGNPTIPAYGVRAGSPPFALEGVAKLVSIALRGKKITDEMCAKYLHVDYPYGCHMVSDDDEYLEFIKTGKGSLRFVPNIEPDWSTKTIAITSYAPGFRNSSAIQKKLDVIANIDGVSTAFGQCSTKNPKAGPYGAYYTVRPVRGINEDSFYELAEQIADKLVSRESYELGFTIRGVEKTGFRKSNFAQLLNNWIRYRIDLELKVIELLLNEAQAKLAYQEILLYAVDNRDMLLKLLPKVLASKDPDETLAKAIKKPVEFAKHILDLRVRKLAALERPAIIAEIKKLKAEIVLLKRDQKQPGIRAAAWTDAQVKEYLAQAQKKQKKKAA